MAISENDIEMEAQQNLKVEQDLGVTISKFKSKLAKVERLLEKERKVNVTKEQEIENLKEENDKLKEENDKLKKELKGKDEKRLKKSSRKEELREKALRSHKDYVTYRKIYGGPSTQKSYDFWKANCGEDTNSFIKSWAKKQKNKKRENEKKQKNNQIVPANRTTNNVDSKNFFISLSGEGAVGVRI